MSKKLFSSLFRYKHWSNEKVFDWLKSAPNIDVSQDTHQAVRILNHVYVVDHIFMANLTGQQHSFEALNTFATPTVAELCDLVRNLDECYIKYVAGLPDQQWDETVRFRFVDGSPGNMTREEMLAHVVTHGDYHRGAVGMILGRMSLPSPRPFTVFIHGHQGSS